MALTYLPMLCRCRWIFCAKSSSSKREAFHWPYWLFGRAWLSAIKVCVHCLILHANQGPHSAISATSSEVVPHFQAGHATVSSASHLCIWLLSPSGASGYF